MLKIEFINKDCKDFYIICDEHRGYFNDNNEFEFNSDCSDYEDQIQNYINETYLKVNYKSKVIYENFFWINEKFKDKYEFILENIVLSEVKKITKEQQKHLR